jgi:hypothetical protein
MRVALRAVRRRNRARLVLAVPVAPPETLAQFRKEAYETICTMTSCWSVAHPDLDRLAQIAGRCQGPWSVFGRSPGIERENPHCSLTTPTSSRKARASQERWHVRHGNETMDGAPTPGGATGKIRDQPHALEPLSKEIELGPESVGRLSICENHEMDWLAAARRRAPTLRVISRFQPLH